MASVRWSPDGARLASASADGTVRIWDAETREEVLRLDGGSAGDLGAHSQGISDVQWSFDGRLLCTCSDDKTLRLWDAASGECLRVLRGHTHFVMCCAFNRQGSVVASGAYDETVRLWEVKTGACVRKLPAHSDPVTAVDFSADSSLLVSSSHDGLCRIWDAETGSCMKTLLSPANPPISFARFTPNSKYVLTASMGDDECCLKLWNYESGKAEKVYRGHTNAKYCLLGSFFTHGGKGPLIVNGSEDGSILFWDVTSQRVVQRISGGANGAGGAGDPADQGPAEDEPPPAAPEDGDGGDKAGPVAGDKAGPAEDAGHSNVVLTTACHPTKPWVASGELGDGATIKIWVRDL